jgi:hypothetical protein
VGRVLSTPPSPSPLPLFLARRRHQPHHAHVGDGVAVVQVGVPDVADHRISLPGAAVRGVACVDRLLELLRDRRLVRASLLGRVRPLDVPSGGGCAVVVVRVRRIVLRFRRRAGILAAQTTGSDP